MGIKSIKFIPPLLTSLLLYSCADQEEIYTNSSSDSLLRIAESMQKSQDFPTAKKLYQQILDSNPHHIEACLGLASILNEEGQKAEAIQLIEENLKFHPQNLPTLKALGKAYISSNNGDKGEIIYKKLNELSPNNAPILNGLGICLDLKGLHAQAQTFYKKALERDHNNISIQSNLGLSLALGGQLEEGINYLIKLSQHPKATPNVKHNLAVAYALAGDHQKANQYFKDGLDQQSIQKNINFLSSLNHQKASSLSVQSSKLDPLEPSNAPTKSQQNKKKITSKKPKNSSKVRTSLSQTDKKKSSTASKNTSSDQQPKPSTEKSLLNNNNFFNGFTDLIEESV